MKTGDLGIDEGIREGVVDENTYFDDFVKIRTCWRLTLAFTAARLRARYHLPHLEIMIDKMGSHRSVVVSPGDFLPRWSNLTFVPSSTDSVSLFFSHTQRYQRGTSGVIELCCGRESKHRLSI